MDLKMKAEVLETNETPIWDVEVKDGIVPIIKDNQEAMQTATLSAFLIRGTIPLLPEAGVPWTEYLTGLITFGEMDAEIRQAIINSGYPAYYPEYDVTDSGEMTVKIGKYMEAENGL